MNDGIVRGIGGKEGGGRASAHTGGGGRSCAKAPMENLPGAFGAGMGARVRPV